MAGGLVVASEIDAAGFKKAGWANITTSDNIVHGQVKAAGNFSFVRVYYAGHQVPFYQPVLALEMFERIINHKDIETGTTDITKSYRTSGSADSTFREGLATVQYAILPANSTYNVTTGAPNPPTS